MAERGLASRGCRSSSRNLDEGMLTYTPHGYHVRHYAPKVHILTFVADWVNGTGTLEGTQLPTAAATLMPTWFGRQQKYPVLDFQRTQPSAAQAGAALTAATQLLTVDRRRLCQCLFRLLKAFK